ncbi:hypothetical protein ACJRO7_036184 [Eucalyptus globulus]|uniref:GATA-type domain-containing protein n=1 Tax=Eucalyptus globulus TaxID=34317 RepID=A0ABD3JAT1_EUCGL
MWILLNETPLWRHGPMEKPVLCNACGSRWRLKGSLDDYVPKRYRAVVRKRRFQNIRDVHEEERIVHAGEVALGDLNLTESFASNKNKSSPESITSEFHQLIKLKAVAASKYSDMLDVNQVPPVKSSFAHIESLQKELYEMYIDQQCASTVAASELIYDNLNRGLKLDNEIGLGVVMLNAPIVAKVEKSGSSPFLWKKNVLALPAEAKGEVFLKLNSIDSSQGVATPQAPADPKCTFQERYKSVGEVSLLRSPFALGGDLPRRVRTAGRRRRKTKDKESIGKPAPGSSSIDGDVSCTEIGKESMPLKDKMACVCCCSSSRPFN